MEESEYLSLMKKGKFSQERRTVIGLLTNIHPFHYQEQTSSKGLREELSLRDVMNSLPYVIYRNFS